MKRIIKMNKNLSNNKTHFSNVKNNFTAYGITQFFSALFKRTIIISTLN